MYGYSTNRFEINFMKNNICIQIKATFQMWNRAILVWELNLKPRKHRLHLTWKVYCVIRLELFYSQLCNHYLWWGKKKIEIRRGNLLHGKRKRTKQVWWMMKRNRNLTCLNSSLNLIMIYFIPHWKIRKQSTKFLSIPQQH